MSNKASSNVKSAPASGGVRIEYQHNVLVGRDPPNRKLRRAKAKALKRRGGAK